MVHMIGKVRSIMLCLPTLHLAKYYVARETISFLSFLDGAKGGRDWAVAPQDKYLPISRPPPQIF